MQLRTPPLRSDSLAALAAALCVTWSVCARGIPILRHDWSLPITQAAMPGALARLFLPWIPSGIGTPQAYPTFYLEGFALYPLSFATPFVVVIALVLLTTIAVAFGGRQVAIAFAGGPLVRLSCTFVALFNPWVYNEIVAGHVFMIFAYAMLLWLIAELLRPQPRRVPLCLFSALLVSQIEFAAFAAIPVLAWLIARRQYLAILAFAIAALPIVFGVTAHYSDIASTPFTLEWQRAQSVAITDGLLLRGYFTHYDAAFGALTIPLALMTCTCPLAIYLSRQRLERIIPIGIGFIAIVFSSGTSGIISVPYSALVLHFSEMGLFRELYDLIAFAAVGVIVGVACVATFSRYVAVALVLLSGSLAIGWIAAPPVTWFVSSSSVQPVEFPAKPEVRVALFPFMQPLTLGGRGNGVDYDAFAQPGRSQPINTSIPEFPVSSALALAASGDTSQLAALGVGKILGRPALQSNEDSLRYTFPSAPVARMPAGELSPYPILGILGGTPPVAKIARSMDRVAIFFGDHESGDFSPIVASRMSASPENAWVDARLAYLRQPQIATNLGGAYTKAQQALVIPPARAALLWTSGRIIDQRGALVSGPLASLAWKQLPAGTTTLRCLGECAVVGVGAPPDVADEGNHERPEPLAIDGMAQWFMWSDIPVHDTSVLRYAVRYEPSFILIGSTARHVRLNQALNGWILPSGPATRVYILNMTAVTQMALEGVCFLALLGLLWYAKASSSMNSKSAPL